MPAMEHGDRRFFGRGCRRQTVGIDGHVVMMDKVRCVRLSNGLLFLQQASGFFTP